MRQDGSRARQPYRSRRRGAGPGPAGTGTPRAGRGQGVCSASPAWRPPPACGGPAASAERHCVQRRLPQEAALWRPRPRWGHGGRGSGNDSVPRAPAAPSRGPAPRCALGNVWCSVRNPSVGLAFAAVRDRRWRRDRVWRSHVSPWRQHRVSGVLRDVGPPVVPSGPPSAPGPGPGPPGLPGPPLFCVTQGTFLGAPAWPGHLAPPCCPPRERAAPQARWSPVLSAGSAGGAWGEGGAGRGCLRSPAGTGAHSRPTHQASSSRTPAWVTLVTWRPPPTVGSDPPPQLQLLTAQPCPAPRHGAQDKHQGLTFIRC